jgi:protein gp37
MKETKIQWTEATWNPWHGCKKVSDGCKFCYMYRDKERYGQDPTTVLKSKTMFKAPLKWKEPKLVFTCSWSDWFIEEADEWRNEAWEIIKATPHLTYQILTKRPERILDHLPDDWGDGYDNVWLGVTVESDKYKHRVKTLARVPAKVRFISAEPLIGTLEFDEERLCLYQKFNWLIIGGESGNKTGKHRYRPAELKWFSSLINDAHVCKMKVFVKQLGTALSDELGLKDRHGGDIEEFPQHLKIRELPDSKQQIKQSKGNRLSRNTNLDNNSNHAH